MGRLVELTQDECRDLLQGEEIGRVAMATPDGPRLLPVNYTFHEGSIYFRTSPISLIGQYGWGNDIAFEVDEVDREHKLGWSVVAVGRADRVDDNEDVRQIREGWDPTPWAEGRRWLYIQMRVRELTGRRMVPSAHAPA
jgi:nitroimidazol reductase NimA-like FMN-containing flavoprotein (pyridoxamine 5'-phosphate oxidase superfamily)